MSVFSEWSKNNSLSLPLSKRSPVAFPYYSGSRHDTRRVSFEIIISMLVFLLGVGILIYMIFSPSRTWLLSGNTVLLTPAAIATLRSSDSSVIVPPLPSAITPVSAPSSTPTPAVTVFPSVTPTPAPSSTPTPAVTVLVVTPTWGYSTYTPTPDGCFISLGACLHVTFTPTPYAWCMLPSGEWVECFLYPLGTPTPILSN